VNHGTSNLGFLRSLNCDGRYGLWLALCLTLLLLPLLGADALRHAWRYERLGIQAGEYWRLITGHLVHLNAAHAVLNAAGLFLLWCLFARSYRKGQWAIALVMSLLSITVGFWFFEPQLQWYVGASGVLHGVFAAGCLALVFQRDVVGIVAAMVFCAKLIWEQWQGPLPFEEGSSVVVVAHLYGAIGGGLAGVAMRTRTPVILTAS
jgi:rhomboid family GlyGly-CTERM serine protease